MNRTSQMDKFGGQYFGNCPYNLLQVHEHIGQEQRNRDYKNIPHRLSISVCQFRFSIRSIFRRAGKQKAQYAP